MIWEALVAIGTLALVGVTWWAFKAQLAVARDQMKVELQMKREEIFDSERLVHQRATLAKQFLNKAPHDEIQEDVMNFFETVGMLLRRGYLDKEMAWVAFSYYGIPWWSACKDYIAEERRRKGEDGTIFAEFGNLVEALYRIEERERGKSRAELEPSPDRLMKFLQEEAALDSRP
ncbi:MAG: DUF4760 domain-containing protein [Limisphaerales bacterium]